METPASLENLPLGILLQIFEDEGLADSDLASAARVRPLNAAAEEALYKRDVPRQAPSEGSRALMWAAEHNLLVTLDKVMAHGGSRCLGHRSRKLSSHGYPFFDYGHGITYTGYTDGGEDGVGIHQTLLHRYDDRPNKHATPLYAAAEHGNDEVLSRLLELGVEIDASALHQYDEKYPCYHTYTPLFAALAAGHGSTAGILLDHGASHVVERCDKVPRWIQSWEPTSLHLALTTELHDIVPRLIGLPNVDILHTLKGFSPLQVACWVPRPSNDILRLLIRQGAAESINHTKRGKSALHYLTEPLTVKFAANYRDEQELRTLACASTLIQAGAKLNMQDNESQTPLRHAAKAWALEVLRFLVRNGAQGDAHEHVWTKRYDFSSTSWLYSTYSALTDICATVRVKGPLKPADVAHVAKCIDVVLESGARATFYELQLLLSGDCTRLVEKLLPHIDGKLDRKNRDDELWCLDRYKEANSRCRNKALTKELSETFDYLLTAFPPCAGDEGATMIDGKPARQHWKQIIESFMQTDAISNKRILDLVVANVQPTYLKTLMSNPWYRHSKHSALLDAVIDAGVSISETDMLHVMFSTPHYKDHLDVVEFNDVLDYLCDKGVDITAQDAAGWTALDRVKKDVPHIFRDEAIAASFRQRLRSVERVEESELVSMLEQLDFVSQPITDHWSR